jgi:hypothetical protein
VLGVGQDSLPSADEAGKRIRASGRPVSPLADGWLQSELNLPELAPVLSLSPKITWPNTRLTLHGQGEYVRSTVQMNFPEPVTGALEPWAIPTNLIREPLVGFTAMRGVAPWLQKSDTLKELELKSVPNQVCLWAQSLFFYQTFCAFPAVDVTNTLIRVGERAPRLLSENWRNRGLGQISWQSTNQQVFWSGLLGITPYLRPAHDLDREFVMGGLFPTVMSTNPIPSELLSQVAGKSNLVYYDWEITQDRLYQWTITSQNFAVITGSGQLRTNTAGLPWLLNVRSHLGNTVTEITARSPAEWSLVRKSHIGFSALELVALTRWLENTRFPRLGLVLPPDLPDRPASAAPAK